MIVSRPFCTIRCNTGANTGRKADRAGFETIIISC
jgi:hypothetical protein